MEHTFKSLFHDGDSISVHHPTVYRHRFYDFIKKQVFLPKGVIQAEHSGSMERLNRRAPMDASATMPVPITIRPKSVPWNSSISGFVMPPSLVPDMERMTSLGAKPSGASPRDPLARPLVGGGQDSGDATLPPGHRLSPQPDRRPLSGGHDRPVPFASTSSAAQCDASKPARTAELAPTAATNATAPSVPPPGLAAGAAAVQTGPPSRSAAAAVSSATNAGPSDAAPAPQPLHRCHTIVTSSGAVVQLEKSALQ